MGYPTSSPTLGLAQPVALAGLAEDAGMVEEAVEDRRRQHFVAEELLPGVEAPVGGQHQRAPRVAVGEQPTEGAAGNRAQGVVADLVEDDQLGPEPVAQEAGQATCRLGRL